VQVYRYLEEDTARFALTRDVGGSRLPVHGAVWLYTGPVRLDPRTRSSRVKAEILKKGYYLWPDDAEALVRAGAAERPRSARRPMTATAPGE
jgi:hypothetical protein